jgi:hypothetical protein
MEKAAKVTIKQPIETQAMATHEFEKLILARLR